MNPRFATTDDAAALVRLINAAYRVEDFFIHGDRTTHEDVVARIATTHGGFLVMGSPGTDALAAAAFVEITGARGHLAMLSVDPSMQKQGLGRQLVSAAEEYCKSAGCTALDIDVVDLRSELPQFYEKLGFLPLGTAPFPQPGKLRRAAHLVLMTKPLTALAGNQ